MSKDLLLVIESVANEKSVDKEIIFSAIEEAIAMATCKKHGIEMDLNVHIDRITGNHSAKRVWTIVDEDFEIENHQAQMYVDIAEERGYDLEVGDVLTEEIEAAEFGRIASQAAKQVIVAKIREAERKKSMIKFKEKIGKILFGEVKRVTREFLIIDLGDNAEGILPRSELIPREIFRINDKIRVCLINIDPEAKGHNLLLSRSDKKMMYALFELEVPEIAEQEMEIVNIAREAGSRSKVAVKSNDKRIDPIGACVGMRGSRVQAIINELNGERVDIVLWDDNPAQYVINAISPAEVVSIIQDEDKNTMDLAIKEDQLSIAIGKNGQNVKLAAELTGWKLKLLAESEAEESKQVELQALVKVFVDALDVESDIGEALVEEGFVSLDEVAYIDTEEMANIEGFDAEIAKELQERAKTALLTQALSGSKTPAEDLLSLEGMTEEFAEILAENDIITMEDLAEQSVDDILDIVDAEAEEIGKLILLARAPWFSQESE
ncbi:MAG: N utilization substance protein A [Francisellaceae bacterium]|jgi:N utilization substance protein A